MQRFFLFSLLFGAAFSQYTPQSGPLNVTEITLNTAASGVLQATTEDAAYHVDLYQIWIPSNVGSVNITVQGSNDDCDLSLFLNSWDLPCSWDDYPDFEPDYMCTHNWVFYDISQEGPTVTVSINTQQDLFQYVVDSYWYVGVGRLLDYQYDEACPYTIEFMAEPTTMCKDGEIVVVGEEGTLECLTPFMISDVTDSYEITGDASSTTVFLLNITSPSYAYVMISVNTTASSLDVFGQNNVAPTEYGYSCYDYGWVDVQGDYYLYNLTCFMPKYGAFYFSLDSWVDVESFSASVTFDVLDCPYGYGGYDCDYPLVEWDPSTPLTANVTVPYNIDNQQEYYGYETYFFYVDIPEGFNDGPDVTVLAVSDGYGYLLAERNGFPSLETTSSYALYESFPAEMGFNQFDWSVPGRLYLALACYDVLGCNVTVQTTINSPVMAH